MALARRSLWFAGLAVVMAAVLFVGCSDDNKPTDPKLKETGTIVIDQTPDVLAGAGWALSGLQNQTGSGDATMAAMPTGTYTLTWDAVSGYHTPSSDTKTLAADGTITFSGTYDADPGPSGDFVLIPAGTFMMGSPEDEPGRYADSETQHQVTLTKGFYMSKHEVTEQWWQQVLGGTLTTSQLPKDHISWDMAVAFCNALSKQAGLDTVYTIHGPNGDVTWNRTANGYRLPTEAEWEYACRATTTMAYHNNTECLSSDTEANFNGRDYQLPGCSTGVYRQIRTAVGTFPSNQWGLHDMHGNVWEWVWDGYRDDYENLGQTDPVHDVGPGAYRALRGGSWDSHARRCRSAGRGSYAVPNYTGFSSGLRPVRSAD